MIGKTAILAKIATLFANNTAGDISESDLREVSNDLTAHCTEYEEVLLSAEQIYSLYGDGPMQILAAPGAGKYTDPVAIWGEYIPGTVEFTNTDPLRIKCGNLTMDLPNTLINNPEQLAAKAILFGGSPSRSLNQNMTIEIPNTDPGMGDGQLRLKIYYNVRTFGTEI